MSILEAILLGIVQGLTEFLPISSSGHLILVPWLQDYTFLKENEDFNKTFDVALHIGTLVAVLAFFRKELIRLAIAFVGTLQKRSVGKGDELMAWIIAIATVPAVIVGFLGEDWIDSNLGEPWMIAILLIVFGLLLYVADRRPGSRDMDSITIRDGIIVGLAQASALAPGVSRSGATITAGRFLHLDRDTAARFSFLMLVPVTIGAGVLKTVEAINDGLPDGVIGPMIVGMIASALSGYAAIAGLLALVRTRSYDGFVFYRVIAGIVVLGLIAFGVREATF